MTRTKRKPNPKMTLEAPCKCSFCHPRFWNSKARKKDLNRHSWKDLINWDEMTFLKKGL